MILTRTRFFWAAVEFAVEDLFPRAEVEFVGGDRDHNFTAHNLPFEMRVGVVFAGAATYLSRKLRRLTQSLRLLIRSL